MKIFTDKLKKAEDGYMGMGITRFLYDNYPKSIKAGELYCIVYHGDGTVEEKTLGCNLVVDSASLLVAQHMKGSDDSPTALPGITHMALGQGAPNVNPLSPPQPDPEQTILDGEIARKAVASTQYVTSDGTPTLNRTNIVDFITQFDRGEATGAIVEAGMFGGEGADQTDGGDMVTKKTFPVSHYDDNTAVLFVWRIFF